MKSVVKYNLFLLLLFPFGMMAQSAYQEIRDGNEAYKSNDYQKAEELFKESLRKDPKPAESSYNLGNALYRQEKYEEAARYYQQAAAKAEDKIANFDTWENIK
mgnify:FL=1